MWFVDISFGSEYFRRGIVKLNWCLHYFGFFLVHDRSFLGIDTFFFVFGVTSSVLSKEIFVFQISVWAQLSGVLILTVSHHIFFFSVDYSMTKKTFAFPKKHNMPFYYVSASDGTNVVKVSANTDSLFLNVGGVVKIYIYGSYLSFSKLSFVVL